MPLRRLASESGLYLPSEVELLGRVFDKLVDPDMDTSQREALASRVIANYMAGIKDEDELASLSKQPLHR